MKVPKSMRGGPLKCWWRDTSVGYGGKWCEKDAVRDVGYPPKWFCEEHARAYVDQGTNS